MKRSTVVALMIPVLAAPAGATAQDVARGSRVRVKTADSRSVGTLTGTTGQLMTLRLENGSEIQVPWATVERLDTSIGKRKNVGQGAAIGLGVGLLAGVVAAKDCEGDFIFSEGECRGMAVTGLGLLGVIGGAIVGALVSTERWKEVDSGPRLALTLPKRGIGAQVRVGW